MIYMKTLNSEEITQLCNAIESEPFRKFFKDSNSLISKYGLIHESLKNAAFIKRIISYLKTDLLLYRYFADTIDNQLELIDISVKGKPMSSPLDVRLAEAIFDSIFKDSIEIYFKLCGIKYNEIIKMRTAEELEQLKLEKNNTQSASIDDENKQKPIEDSKSQKLRAFDDTCKYEVIDENLHERNISIFQVQKNNNSNCLLIRRLADLNIETNKFVLFEDRYTSPSVLNPKAYFEHKSGPKDVGFYGVWSWRSVPKITLFDEDQIESNYMPNISHIELCLIDGVNSIEELVDRILKGVQQNTHSNRVMFFFKESYGGRCKGVLCSKEALVENKGKTKLSGPYRELPVYSFLTTDEITLSTHKKIYKKLFAGIPESIYKVHSSQSQSSQTAPSQEISSHATSNKTSENIQMKNSDTTKANHQPDINTLKDELKTNISEVIELKNKLKLIDPKIQKIQDITKNLEDKLQEIINASSLNSSNISTALSSDIKDQDVSNTIYSVISKDKASEKPPVKQWDKVITVLEKNLSEAGVIDNSKLACCYGLAVFLCANYILRQPVLLTGPNVKDICVAMSYAFDDGRYGVLNCTGEFNQAAVEQIGSNGEHIVFVNNLITSNWVNHIQDILKNNEIFFIVGHPFKEDLQVEPSSLFNFLLPILIEPIVDDIPYQRYTNSHLADSLHSYFPEIINRERLTILNKVNVSPLQMNNMNHIFSIMKIISKLDPSNIQNTPKQHGLNLIKLLFTDVTLAYINQSLHKLYQELSNHINNGDEFQNIKDLIDYLVVKD